MLAAVRQLRKLRTFGLLIAAAVIGGTIFLVAGDSDSGRRAGPLDPGRATAFAESACARFAQAVSLIRADSPAPRVFKAVEETVQAAEEAVFRDPIWAELASGAQAVRAGLRRNDAEIARRGGDAMRRACARPELNG